MHGAQALNNVCMYQRTNMSLKSYTLFIAERYLRARRKTAISVITVISISGVALGVAALSIALSISTGFQKEFQDKVLGVNAHVLVMKYGVFREYRDVLEKVRRRKDIRGAEPFVISEMMIANEGKTSGVLVKGVDPVLLPSVMDLPRYIIKGSIKNLAAGEKKEGEKTPLSGIIIGSTLAENLRADVGDTVLITTPMVGMDLSLWSRKTEAPRSLEFSVAGIFYSGFLEYDTKLVYMDIKQSQRFFDRGDAVVGIEITLHDIAQARETAESLLKELGGAPYHTLDWEELNRNLFTALKLQKIVLTIILASIIGVAAFTIIATLIMMVIDRRREIAILKSMGATNGNIMQIFMIIGSVVGFGGIIAGLAVGIGSCLLLEYHGWPLDPKVYLIDHLPVVLEPLNFLICAGVAFVICFISTIAPSWTAAKLNPVDGLRPG